MSRVSRGVKKASICSSCGTTPIERRARRGRTSMSKSQIRATPAVLTTSPARMLIRVDLPAPFGPSRPNTVPRGTARSMPLSASLSGCAAAAAIDLAQAFDLDRQRRRAVAPCDLAQTVGIEHWQGEVAAILWHLVHDLFRARRQAAAVNDLVTARLLTKKR